MRLFCPPNRNSHLLWVPVYKEREGLGRSWMNSCNKCGFLIVLYMLRWGRAKYSGICYVRFFPPLGRHSWVKWRRFLSSCTFSHFSGPSIMHLWIKIGGTLEDLLKWACMIFEHTPTHTHTHTHTHTRAHTHTHTDTHMQAPSSPLKERNTPPPPSLHDTHTHTRTQTHTPTHTHTNVYPSTGRTLTPSVHSL